MKYEMIFGDEKLFDGVPDDCFCVAKNVYDDSVFYKEVDRCLFWLDGKTWKPLRFMSCTPIAMRHIIKEPKRWTAEDQKAGRLPEVGCEIFNSATGENEVLFSNGRFIVTLSSNGVVGKYDKEEVSYYFKPLETPEQKAQRERNEWAKKASQFIDDELDCVNIVGEHVMRRFYNAMLTGDLPVPVKGAKNER